MNSPIANSSDKALSPALSVKASRSHATTVPTNRVMSRRARAPDRKRAPVLPPSRFLGRHAKARSRERGSQPKQSFRQVAHGRAYAVELQPTRWVVRGVVF